MSIMAILGLDTKPFEQKLKESENKVDASARKMDKSMKNVKGPSMTQVLQTGTKAGGAGSLSGRIGDVGGALGMGGGAGAAAAGIGAGIAILGAINKYLEVYRQNLKLAAEMAEYNTQQTDKYIASREKQRASDLEAAKSIEVLSNVDKLSNVQRLEAINAIEKLEKKYGDLGVKIDETTGKIIDSDTLQKTILQKNNQDEIADIDKKIRALRNEYQEQEKIFDDGNTWYGFLPGVTGWDDAKDAAKKQSDLIDQISELSKKQAELKKKDPSGDYDKKLLAKLRDEENALSESLRSKLEANADKNRQRKYSQSDDDEKILMRQEDVTAELAKQAEIQQKINDVMSEMPGTEMDQIRQQNELLKLHSQLEDSLQNQYSYEQDIYEIQQKQYKDKAQKAKEFGTSLLEDIKRAQNELSGNEFANKLMDAEKAKGSALTQEELAQLQQLADLQEKLSGRSDFSLKGEFKTNELANRGGFESSVVDTSMRRTTEQILSNVKDIPAKLDSIKMEMREVMTY